MSKSFHRVAKGEINTNKYTLFPKAEKVPTVIFRAYILIEAQPRSIIMARKIIKPIFSRPREIRVLSQEDYLTHRYLYILKARNESFISVRSERLQAQCWYR